MEYDRDEFQRAIQQGLPLAWDISEAYVLRPQSVGSMQGQMAIFDEGPSIRRYAPSVHPEMVTSFAKLHTEDSTATVEWVQRWGLLGFQTLSPLSEPGLQGEPLCWIWAHARTVDFCMQLDYLLTEKHIEDLTTLLASLSERFPLAQIPHEPVLVHAVLGGLDVTAWYPLGGLGLEDPDTLIDVARRMQRELVNRNIARIGFRLTDRNQGNNIEIHCATLLEVIYWHLAQSMSKGLIRRCANTRCGKPFLATRDNQFFCPAQYWQKQSSCAAGARMARMRQGKRAMDTNGTT